MNPITNLLSHRRYAAGRAASLSAAQMRCGVAGMSMWRMPQARQSASLTALMSAGQEPMVGLAMFYRLLVAEAAAELELPRVSLATRDAIVREIEDKGAEGFTFEALDEMERANPELLQMAHGFASRQRSYLGMMQGFALIYASLTAQSEADRVRMH